MSYTIQNAYDDIAGIVHGKTVSKITNIESAAARAGRNLLAVIDPDETRKYAQITLYDGVTDYNLPMTDLKEKRIFDVRPQVNRARRDNLSSRMSKDFDQKKNDNQFSVEDDGGTKYLRVNKSISPGASSIDPVDDTTNWSASGGASGLAQDTIYTLDDGNSLKFDLAAASTPGVLTNSAIGPIDLSTWQDVASFFLWVYLPTAATNITTVTLRIGTSATKYWEMTGVVHFGSQQIGWNLIRFDWSGATKTSTPVSTALSYVRLSFAYGASAVSGIRVDKLFVSLPKIWIIGYYSKFIFNNGGTWAETVADTSTTVNLDTGSYNLFVYEFALAALQQIQGKDAQSDRDYFKKELYGDPSKKDELGKYDIYKMNNPSQAEKVTQTYYSNTGFKRK